MANLLAKGLNQVGLYRPVKKALRLVSDEKYRQREFELRHDLKLTRSMIGSWAAQGAENSDPNKLFGIVSFTDLPMHAKFQALVGKTMQLQGYTPVVFTNSSIRFGSEYFRLFGINRFVMWDKLIDQSASFLDRVDELVLELLPFCPTVAACLSIKFNEVEVGKHALSMVCRKRVEGRLNLNDPLTLDMFKSEFRRSIHSVLIAEEYFKKNPFQKLLIRDSGYTPNGAIFEVALREGVDCVVFEVGQRRGTWTFKRYTRDSKGLHYFSLSPSTWDRIRNLPWTSEDDEKLQLEFTGRYKPDSTEDTRRLQSGKQMKSPQVMREELGLDPQKKTAVIFSHVAWDAAFFFGTCLFDDFEDWLFQTVQFVAQECQMMNWIVKVHPFNVFKLRRESVQETSEMRLLRPLFPLPDHVKIMQADTNINTQSLFPLVDYVLTVNGTVGMEFPCYGVPAVVAGTGRYNGRGFTIDPKTKEEYLATLKNLHTVPRLNDEVKQLARKHFYSLMVGRQTSFEDVAPMELKRLHEAQSDVHDNIRINATSLDDLKRANSLKFFGEWLANQSEEDLIQL